MRRVTTTFKTLRPAVVLIGDQATEDFTSIEATVVWQHIGSKMLGGDISNVTNIDDGGCYGHGWAQWKYLHGRLGGGSPDMRAVRGRQGSELGRVSFSWNCQSVCIQWLWSIIAGQWRRFYSSQPEYQPASPARCSQLFLDACCVNEISQKFSQYLENAPTSTLFLLKEFTSACASFIMVSSPDIWMLNVSLQRSFRWTHSVSAPFTAVGEGNSRPHLQFLWKLSRNYIDTSNACRVQCDSFQSNLLSDGLLV